VALRRLRVWWIVISQVGPVARLGRQMDEFTRYYVLKTLADEGLLDYLQEPRTIDQILAEFDYVDGDYIHGLLSILATDKRNVLIAQDGLYRHNPAQPLPTFDEILARTDKRYHSLAPYTKGMARHIPDRLRGQHVGLSQSNILYGRQLSELLDRALGNVIYTGMRSAAFALLTRQERAWLRGKMLLDVGCGSGREPVELWLHLQGDVRLTAIDPAPVLLELAEASFSILLEDISLGHPPLTEANYPVFEDADVTDLPFEDDSFDAAFYSQILHWTPDPRRAISEIVRVVKPDGLIFGVQGGKPQANPYMDAIIRADENCHGFFWMDEYRGWYAEHGLRPEIVTPAGVFRVRKQEGL
jgi:ubiquinone/menaquinone biosynthesis C-methylase UbiE